MALRQTSRDATIHPENVKSKKMLSKFRCGADPSTLSGCEREPAGTNNPRIACLVRGAIRGYRSRVPVGDRSGSAAGGEELGST